MMILLRVSGHSGAGKSRLLKEIHNRGLLPLRVILLTSRSPRPGEVDGVDYNFVSREYIRQLPIDTYFIGPVRDMLQAVDLVKLDESLRTNDIVVIEIYHRLWAGLEQALRRRIGEQLRTASVFLCAVDLNKIRSLEEAEARMEIEEEVKRILSWRGTEEKAAVAKRAQSAVSEILSVLTGSENYDRILRTSPEGPDGEDDWTCPEGLRGKAAEAVEEFIAFINTLRRDSDFKTDA